MHHMLYFLFLFFFVKQLLFKFATGAICGAKIRLCQLTVCAMPAGADEQMSAASVVFDMSKISVEAESPDLFNYYYFFGGVQCEQCEHAGFKLDMSGSGLVGWYE